MISDGYRFELFLSILWTALSVALGLELRGEYIRGVPCVKKYQQLFCPTAGNAYPLDKIEYFIDENKALMKRMFGEFNMSPDIDPGLAARKYKRSMPGVPDLHSPPGPDSEFLEKLRTPRQALPPEPTNSSGLVDACESKTEIITPFWASSLAGKMRAVVNTMHFEQAVRQELCITGRTGRCRSDCSCEQKYKWHRMLAYDPNEDCKGIFMDWFLFPSCCVCRCKKS